jgi:hypothetical protein
MACYAFPALNPDTNEIFTDAERKQWIKDKRGLIPDDWVKDLPKGAMVKTIFGPTPIGITEEQIYSKSNHDYINNLPKDFKFKNIQGKYPEGIKKKDIYEEKL